MQVNVERRLPVDDRSERKLDNQHRGPWLKTLDYTVERMFDSPILNWQFFNYEILAEVLGLQELKVGSAGYQYIEVRSIAGCIAWVIKAYGNPDICAGPRS